VSVRTDGYHGPVGILDGGHDAPLTPSGRRLFYLCLFGLIALGVGLIIVTELTSITN
jgi:hypothetical protein